MDNLAKIEGDEIVIRIPTVGFDGFGYHGLADVGLDDDDQIELIDMPALIVEVVSQLNAETEDGSTLVHYAIDQAIRNASENGSPALSKLDEREVD